MAWPFLSATSREHVCTAFPVFLAYARLRRYAHSADVTPLLQQRRHTDASDSLPSRIQLMSAALLQFDFSVGDLVRWLGGDYVHEYMNFDALEDLLEPIRSLPPRPGQPPVDIDLAMRIWREVPPSTATTIASDGTCIAGTSTITTPPRWSIEI